MSLFNDPVRARVSYSPDKDQIGAPVLVMGWDEGTGRFLVCDSAGTASMWDIDHVTFEWRWVDDRAAFPAAMEFDRVAENWIQKTGPGWLDTAEMAPAPE